MGFRASPQPHKQSRSCQPNADCAVFLFSYHGKIVSLQTRLYRLALEYLIPNKMVEKENVPVQGLPPYANLERK
jgi:hypothetical protein